MDMVFFFNDSFPPHQCCSIYTNLRRSVEIYEPETAGPFALVDMKSHTYTHTHTHRERERILHWLFAKTDIIQFLFIFVNHVFFVHSGGCKSNWCWVVWFFFVFYCVLMPNFNQYYFCKLNTYSNCNITPNIHPTVIFIITKIGFGNKGIIEELICKNR